MTAEIISGKEVAQVIRQQLKEETGKLKQKGIVPGLAVILAGDDPASASYVRGKEKACRETGIHSTVDRVSASISEEDLLGRIEELNQDPSIHGILVQLPLPDHISEHRVIDAISPLKDVDGFHPVSIGNMVIGRKAFLPCTPHGIIRMLKSKDIPIEGSHAVIVGRSNIVGKPVGQLLLNENATVTYCHSRTKNMQEITKQADILIAAVGKKHFITADDIKEGAVVVDVGINRTEEGTLTGDVDFESVKEKAGYITPVPGGVGPMTITMLLANTVQSAQEGAE
ncbi:bifunctional methylenetetrahydrofolate dehydrogenase/methenyltetrahydrofolate cyclohydrolase FolD [Alkalicoccus urumqiensis]|uniref:Bifunctional protein FolD n=1 Tax=Alkalicoccus urumqiensis TaxID=1548213 RepID=A0A2P6MKA2_ALKUR|nr:bifunctional methylenetetrahydrofolate dehydrogenase/methenyltetrahydrofolate cyclohydrolase FolD [Alkalicoccus urumqiensis]PRO66710.1 bifunctional methylenetetrahydrofolate dehydrogenase/methenyltetrahydrofolate cyclohydrolase FolD [Alkalicoccus urumqiensis]